MIGVEKLNFFEAIKIHLHKKSEIRKKKWYFSRLICAILVFTLMLNQLSFAQEIVDINEETNKADLDKVRLQAVLTPPYVIGPGDQLNIIDRTLKDVFGTIEQFNVTVSADGYITIPLPDGTQVNILAAGYTLDELSVEVRSLFGKTLKNPLVFVQILRYRPINLYIGGEIVKPGIYKVESTSSSEKGGSVSAGLNTFGLSITEAIQIAGGLKPRANIKEVTVTRGSNSEKEIVNLLALLTQNDTAQDISLQPGDAIFIPAAEKEEDQAQSYITLLGKLAFQDVPVNIVGQVKTPGNFSLTNDSTLLDAIGKAGGLSDIGTLTKIKLLRYDEKGIYRKFDLNVEELLRKGITFEQIALRPNDTIELEVSKKKSAQKFMRDTGKLIVPLVFSNFSNNVGQYILQDAFFARNRRAGNSRLTGAGLPFGTTDSSITIIGAP